jgi:glycosyltransferase involved in cell wall biosynthesis
MDALRKEKNRIAIIGYKFCFGGLEKVMSDVSILLEKEGNDLVTIVLDDAVCYPNGGQLIELGKENKINKYLKLNKILKTSKFDYIIDFRYRLNPFMELLFLFCFYKKEKVIYTVHSSRIESFFTKKKWIEKLIFKKAYKIVCVSEAIKNKLKTEHKIENIDIIYNGFDFTTINKFANSSSETLLPFKYIIAVGRLSKEKQFDKLIETYSKSILPSKEIHLLFLGSGSEEVCLKEKANITKVKDKIHFLGHKQNPYFYIKNAQFLVLCSLYEGFPMAILESLAIGTPVVSFDCPSGPGEMIQNDCNGILVENQNFDELLKKMNKLVNEDFLLNEYKENTQKSVLKFENKEIIKSWNLILI